MKSWYAKLNSGVEFEGGRVGATAIFNGCISTYFVLS